MAMTNRERLNAVLRSEPVDRPPVGFWFHHLESDDMTKGIEDPKYFAKNIAGHKAFIEGFKPDLVKIMSDGYFFYPYGLGKNYDTAEDLVQITPIESTDQWITDQVELASQVVAIAGPDTPTFYNVFSPLQNLTKILGDKFRLFYVENEEATLTSYKRIAEGLTILIDELFAKTAVDGIYLSVTSLSDQLTPSEYASFASPVEEAFLAHIKEAGKLSMLHICGYGGKRNDLSVFQNYDADIINWACEVEKLSLAEGKKYFGGKPVLGGFANEASSLIATGSKEEIQAFARKALEEAGLVGTMLGADCTVPSDISWEHLEWVREVAKDLAAATA